MRRGVALAVVMLALTAWRPHAAADAIDDQIESLGGGGVKLRLSATVALSRATEDRAVLALAKALKKDKDASVRRAAALALKKVVTPNTGKAARTKALDALKAAKKDKNKKVRSTASSVLKALEEILAVKWPAVFVNLDPATDKTKRAPARAVTSLDKVVKAAIARASSEYAVDWPGTLPTARDLEKNGTKGFIVGAKVTKLAFDKKGSKVTVSCTVEIRVSPWNGSDDGERWVSDQTATASGNAKAETGSTDASMAGGVVDCVTAVGEKVITDKITPFIKKIVKASK